MQEKLEKVGSSRTQSIKHNSILITSLHSSHVEYGQGFIPNLNCHEKCFNLRQFRKYLTLLMAIQMRYLYTIVGIQHVFSKRGR